MYFRISRLYPPFQTSLRSDLIIDFSHHLALSVPILYRLPTPQTIPTSIFRYPIPFAFRFPLRATFPNTAILSAPIPFPSPILSVHCPLNPSDLRTSPDTSCARLLIHPYATDADRTANWGQLVFQWGGDDTLQDSLGRINAISDIFTTYSGYMR